MILPDAPEIDELQYQECQRTGDFRSILFEWYKYVGRISNYFASVELRSPAIRDISKIHHSVLIGLLNRCSRLILSNVTLSKEGRFRETTSIIDRSIFESAIKLSWLCIKQDEESFNRFIAEGLKTEVEFKDIIKQKINSNEGKIKIVEDNMLTSIENYINKSGLDEETIKKSKKLPNLAQMIEDIGKDRLAYVVGQRIGSHHVHGTWVSLWFDYLTEEDGIVYPRDHNCPTHSNQYVYISLSVLEALSGYVKYLFLDQVMCEEIIGLLEAATQEIVDILHEMSKSDYVYINKI